MGGLYTIISEGKFTQSGRNNKFAKTMKDDIMSISEQEKAQLFQCERRMAIMIAAKQLQAPKVPIMV